MTLLEINGYSDYVNVVSFKTLSILTCVVSITLPKEVESICNSSWNIFLNTPILEYSPVLQYGILSTLRSVRIDRCCNR